MKKQFLIIGLGQFGMSLARHLSERGMEVLAVDTRKQLVEEAAQFVTEALTLDATDETELARIKPSSRDAAICAIGDESRESSIICSALLKQMGVPLVIARANDKLHYRILSLIGVDKIINPEQEFGKRFAHKLLYGDSIIDSQISDELHISEIKVQSYMENKTLIELKLPNKFGATVVGIRQSPGEKVSLPNPNEPLNPGATLVIVCTEETLPQIIKDS